MDELEELENDLIDTSLKVAKERAERAKVSHHESLWEWLLLTEMEKHRMRIEKIRAFITRKRTGEPF